MHPFGTSLSPGFCVYQGNGCSVPALQVKLRVGRRGRGRGRGRGTSGQGHSDASDADAARLVMHRFSRVVRGLAWRFGGLLCLLLDRFYILTVWPLGKG